MSTPCPPAARRLALPLLAAAVLASAATAQEGSSALPFLDRVEVNVVNLEVFVTDAQGRAIAGLEPDDFAVRVDGEPVEITNFHVGDQLRRRTASSGAATGEAAVQPQAQGGTDPTPRTAPHRRPLHLVAYVDHVNLSPNSRRRVLDALRTVVAERAAAGDRVMLAGYDGAVKVLQPFSSDPEALEAGLERLGEETPRRQLADSQLRQSILEIQRLLASDHASAIAGVVARYRQERVVEAQGSFRALHSVVRSLGGLPGRKALLYVSDGIPRTPAADLLALLSGGVAPLSARREDLSHLYEAIAETANAYEVTLYTMDARGSDPSFFRSAASRSLSGLPGEVTDADFVRDTNLREPLLDMAEATGGRAVVNTNDIGGALDALVADFGSYYSLGIAAGSGDGEYHRIEVEVEGPGLEVRHRSGYVDKPTEERIADRTLAFLLQGWQSNPLGVELGFGEPNKRRKHWRVPVLVRIPADAVTLLPRGDRMVGRVKIFLATRDDEGRTSEVTRLPQEIELPRSVATDGDGGLGYSFQVDLRPGPGALVVGVWDEVGGAESYVYQRINVGE